ncbi:MAG: hypothetical protein IJ555_04910 [Ruminococcus sp.]|nr:hypothetical protein [Ruminococcus sp.]
MSRPSKCRICGYRFKSGEDICPECFTARDDDITCSQFSEEEHTHSGGFSTTEDSDIYDEFKEKSFIDNQRKDEANDPIPTATYGGKMGTPPPTYASQSYNNPQNSYQGSSRQDKLNAIKNGYYSSVNRSAPQNTFYSAGRQNTFGSSVPPLAFQQRQTPRKKSSVGIFVFIFIILTFILPIIIIISSVSDATKRQSENEARANRVTSITIDVSMPDFSFPDISIPDPNEFDVRAAYASTDEFEIESRHMTRYVPFSLAEADKFAMEDELGAIASFIQYYEAVDQVRVMGMDLEITTSGETEYFIDPANVTLVSLDSAGREMMRSTIFNLDEAGTKLTGCMFIVPEESYNFVLEYSIKDGDDYITALANVYSFNLYDEYESYGYVFFDEVLPKIDLPESSDDE